MNQYLDIGYKVTKEEDVNDLLRECIGDVENLRLERISDKVVWGRRNVDKITFCFYVEETEKSNNITDFAFSYINLNASEVKFEGLTELGHVCFPLLSVSLGDIPFWFVCLNYDKKTKRRVGSKCKVHIACLANYVEIKDPTPHASESKSVADYTPAEIKKTIDNLAKNIDKLGFADESYVSSGVIDHKDMATAFISGIVEKCEKVVNRITNIPFYVVDITTLGLNVKLLIAEELVDETQLKEGKIISGEFWGSCFIEN